MSSNIYQQKDSPRFRLGHGVVIAYMTLFLLGGSVMTTLLLRRENSNRLAGKRDHWAEGKPREEVEKLGDKRPDFLYTT